MIRVYIGCYLFIAAMYLLMARACVHHRLPAATTCYAFFCALATAATAVGCGLPGFRRDFMAIGVPIILTAWAVFCAAEICQRSAGQMTRTEARVALALAAGTILSFAAGKVVEEGYLALALQTALDIVPIIVALALIGAPPLAEPVPQPSVVFSSFGAPVPPEAVAIR